VSGGGGALSGAWALALPASASKPQVMLEIAPKRTLQRTSSLRCGPDNQLFVSSI